jgi:uncharacterized phage-associated protein
MLGNKCDIIDLTKFIICYFKENGIRINHLKLQKILYYIQAWHLVYFDKNPLFYEEPEAWVNGPVYRKVYAFLKSKSPSLTKKENISIIKIKFSSLKDKLNLEKEQYEFLDAIFNYYGSMSHEKLVFMTHWELPWKDARKDIGPFDNSTNKITHDSMYNYFNKKLEINNAIS